MKTKLSIIIVVIMTTNLHINAQVNLVPNPSFEDTVACPVTISEIFKADYWYAFSETPDYYHVCDNPLSGIVGVPQNYLGYQFPHSGNAHAGIVAYDLTGAPLREYLAVKLSTNNPIIVDTKYYFTFFVSWLGSPGFGIAINKLGIALTNTQYSTSNPYPITNNPKAFSDSIYFDSLGWSKVTMSFVADSSYQYLVIGDFFDDSHTDTLHLGQFNTHCYYYIDDVCLSTDSNYAETWTNILNEISKNDMNLYPNPASNKIIVEASININEIRILDCSERVIYSRPYLGVSKFAIDISFLTDGLYFMELISGERNTIKKFIKTTY